MKGRDTETRRVTEVSDLKRLEMSLIKGPHPPPCLATLPPAWPLRKLPRGLQASCVFFFHPPWAAMQKEKKKKTAFRVSQQPLIYLSVKCGTKSESQ